MDDKAERFILHLLAHHNICTIATVRGDGYPQATTVAYVNDGFEIYFVAGRESQKVANIRKNNKVSLTVDHDYQNWNKIKGLSLGGIADVIVDPEQREKVFDLFTAKFPQVREMPMPEDLDEIAVVHVHPQVVSVLDYTKEFGHTELVTL